jgi:hypothetical protein
LLDWPPANPDTKVLQIYGGKINQSSFTNEVFRLDLNDLSSGWIRVSDAPVLLEGLVLQAKP